MWTTAAMPRVAAGLSMCARTFKGGFPCFDFPIRLTHLSYWPAPQPYSALFTPQAPSS